MKPKTLEALKASIERWERLIVTGAQCGGATACPLCRMFNNKKTPDDCVGCPVFEKTGKKYCVSTPFARHSRIAGFMPDFADRRRRAALAETRFLRSLLP